MKYTNTIVLLSVFISGTTSIRDTDHYESPKQGNVRGLGAFGGFFGGINPTPTPPSPTPGTTPTVAGQVATCATSAECAGGQVCIRNVCQGVVAPYDCKRESINDDGCWCPGPLMGPLWCKSRQCIGITCGVVPELTGLTDNLPNGANCTSDAVCNSNNCLITAPATTGQCVAPCTDTLSQCFTGYKCTTSGDRCEQAICGVDNRGVNCPCTALSQCQSGLICDSGSCKRCPATNRTTDCLCDLTSQCANTLHCVTINSVRSCQPCPSTDIPIGCPCENDNDLCLPSTSFCNTTTTKCQQKTCGAYGDSCQSGPCCQTDPVTQEDLYCSSQFGNICVAAR